MAYIYRCSSTGYSSKRYGVCEVCKQHATEVFLQVEMIERKPDECGRFLMNTGLSWFGHESCLAEQRKAPYTLMTPDEYYRYKIDRRQKHEEVSR